jgi:protein SCO1/2
MKTTPTNRHEKPSRFGGFLAAFMFLKTDMKFRLLKGKFASNLFIVLALAGLLGYSPASATAEKADRKGTAIKMSIDPVGQKPQEPVMGTRKEILKRSEASIGKSISNYKLVNQDGNHLQFRSLRGKVILMNFIYLDCPDMCVLMALSLKKFMANVDPALKDDFIILSVSFDPKDDTPEKLKDYASDFTDDFSNWHFTTTDEYTIRAMVDELGFSFEQKGEEFNHLNRLSLIGPDGKVLRHYYGTDYKVEEVEKEIKEAKLGNFVIKNFSRAINSIFLYCSIYNQETKTFETDYFIIGGYVLQYLLVILTAYLLYRQLWRKDPEKTGSHANRLKS